MAYMPGGQVTNVPFKRRRLFLRSTGIDIMPEIVQKTMIVNGRMVEIPAHLDWRRLLAAGPARSSSMRILRHIGSTLIAGFIFRPFVLLLLLPGMLISLGAVSLQNARYFNDADYMGVELRRIIEGAADNAVAPRE